MITPSVMAHEFFNFIEHLIEDQIPEQVKNILLLTGFSCRTAFLNTSHSWLEDIEEFIRSQSECDYYRNRMPHGLNLQHFSLPPGYKAVLIGIKTKLEHHHRPGLTHDRVPTPATAICMQPEPHVEQIIHETTVAANATPSTSSSHQQSFKPISVVEATDILDNVLRCWQRTHEISTTVKYNISNKHISSVNGDLVTKISATVICPDCEKPIQVYMDELKKRWIVSNFNSHFNRVHKSKQENTIQQRWQQFDLINNFYGNHHSSSSANNSATEEVPLEVQYDSVTRSFYSDGAKNYKIKTENNSSVSEHDSI